MIGGVFLPTLNACLNATSAVLLVSGYVAIRLFGSMRIHRAFMLSAFAVSAVFLTSYLYYHAHAGATHYLGTGWRRPIYFTILVTHSILAAAIVPMVLVTMIRALRGRFEAHRALARWTFPVWLYVSVTGVVVYWMLY